MSIETTYSQARQSLKSLLDRVVDDREVVTIKRRNGGAAVIIAADELASLEETAHLLRSPANAERLLTALTRSHTASLEPTTVPALERLVEGADHP